MTPGWEQHLRWIEDQSAAFAAAIPGDLELRVPTCPEWNARDLVVHLGDVQRFCAIDLACAGERPSEVDLPDPPPSREGLLAWYVESYTGLIAALRVTGPSAPAWTWWGEPGTAAAIARHQAQEAGVHRIDASHVTVPVGQPLAALLPPELADDAVAEFLEISLGAGAAELERLTLTACDTGTRWDVGALPPAQGSCEVIGSAADLLLSLFRRPAAVQIKGSPGPAQRLFAAADNT